MISRAVFSAGISWNCLRTSWIIDIAALPTAPMAKALNKKGSIAPINSPAITLGADTSIISIPAVSLKANNARAVRAAEPIAKPFTDGSSCIPNCV